MTRRPTRWLASASAILLIVGATACGPAPSAGGGTGAQYARAYRPDGSAAPAAGQALDVELGDMYFRPNTLTAAPGAQIILRLHNGSPIAHNLTLQAFGVSQDVAPGQTRTITFTPTAAGVYYFYCDVPGHAAAGMVGKLTVQ